MRRVSSWGRLSALPHEVIELADTLFAKGAMTLTLLGDFNDKFQIKNINLPA